MKGQSSWCFYLLERVTCQFQDHKEGAPRIKLKAFWRDFLDLRSHFGARWILNGGTQINIKYEKGVSRKASGKID